MARLDAAALAFLVFALALSAWAPGGAAGTPDAPEITDPADDHVAAGVVPLGGSGQFLNADILAGWITEDADNLLFNILIAGGGAPGTAGPYTWTFHCTAGAAELEASGTTADEGPTPGGAATAAAFEEGVVTLTVPRDALGGVTELTGCHIESGGGTPDPTQPDVVISDLAPDDGEEAGVSYQVTGGGAASGSPGDADGDGLNDTKEQQQFGNVTAQDGTGDPDQDGLNNTAEFQKGTNATRADTDGDGANDKEDPFPLDPAQGGAANATSDADKDGLNDTWERKYFNSTAAQRGAGDPDADGLNNTAEQKAGTDPAKADTDGDGLTDAADEHPLEKAEETSGVRPELYSGAVMFAAAATFLLFALARGA